MTGSADILFYVQHLLGIGHLRRSAAIVRALDAAGLRVVLVSGGLPVQGIDMGGVRLVQLPPLKSLDEQFSRLADGEGRAVDEAWKAARAARLLEVFRAARPRLLVTEMFPLGRRQMRFELLPLLEAAIQAIPRPAIVCSVRDILNEPRSADKSRWMAATLDRYFDRVLVHGDPEVATLDLTFPRIAEVTPEVTYTGYVVSEAPARPEPNAAPDAAGTGEVLVSAGGGRVAGPLIEAVLAARPRAPLKNAQWRILVGEHTPPATYEAWVQRAPAGVTVERWRPDFQALLSRCLLSISQAGYNTVMEVLKSGRPALVVPFAAGSETEQSRRASLLAERGLLAVINEAELSAERLNRGLRQALTQADRPSARPIDMAGARKTAAILQDMLATLPPMNAWQRLDQELESWRRSGRIATFWWRDDDAADCSPALDRLLGLAEAHGVPLSLAVIPALATAALAELLAATAMHVSVLQHGFDHANHAPPGEKSMELGLHRPRVAICEELADGQAMLKARFGGQALPVLVPPWNRIAGEFVPELAGLGFRGVSLHTARAAVRPAKGLVACNTHVDILRWRPERGFLGENEALDLLIGHLRARRQAGAEPLADGQPRAEPDEPSGLLTHHLVMDEAAWSFVSRLLATLGDHPAARWVTAEEAFHLPTARRPVP